MINIRPATQKDVPSLCELYLDFHEYHVDRVPKRLLSLRGIWDTEKSCLVKRLGDIIEDSESTLLVAENGEEIIGFSELYLRQDEQSPARMAFKYCHLQSLFVVTAHRLIGVGRLLLEASESWARSKGASEIRLDTWDFPDGPVDFYERYGFRTYRLSLSRSLDKT
jgi:GNAT superfamily N-acetyltransferase